MSPRYKGNCGSIDPRCGLSVDQSIHGGNGPMRLQYFVFQYFGVDLKLISSRLTHGIIEINTKSTPALRLRYFAPSLFSVTIIKT